MAPTSTSLTVSPVVLDATGDLTCTWFEQSPRRSDAGPRAAGVETALLEVSTNDSVVIARLHVSFTTPALGKVAFPTLLHFAEVNLGWDLGLTGRCGSIQRVSTPAEMWASAHRAASVPALSRSRGKRALHASVLTSLDAPTDTAVLDSDMRVLLDTVVKPVKRAFTRYMSTPYVAGISVNDTHQGRGVATRMYVLAAQHLALSGRVLRSSGMQTPDAQGLWNSLNANLDLPTATIRLRTPKTGEQQTYSTLDYR